MENEYKRKIKVKSGKWLIWFWSVFAIYFITSTLIKAINGEDSWSRFGAIAFATIMFVILIIRYSKDIKKKLAAAASLKIIINDESITRELLNEPARQILFKDIHSIVKEEDGSIRINGNDGIWIPDDIDNFKSLEQKLESCISTVQTNEVKIITEQPFESFDNFLESVQKKFAAVSIFTAIVILCSYLKLYLYYDLYDISIYNYLDASEIIFSFTSLSKEFIILIIAFVFIHKGFAFIRLRVNIIETRETRLKNNFAKISIVVYILGLAYIYISIPEMLSIERAGNELLAQQIGLVILSFFIACGLSLMLYAASLFLKERERFVTLPLTSLAIIFTFLLITYIENRVSYDLLTNGHPKYHVNILLSNEEKVESSDSNLYIGSTNQYLFFRDNSKKVNVIIPRSSIIKEQQKLLRRGL